MSLQKLITGLSALIAVSVIFAVARPTETRAGGNIEGIVNGGSQIKDLRWSDVALPVQWRLNDQGAANNFNNGNTTSVSVNDTRDAVEQGFFAWSAVNTSCIDFQYDGLSSTTDIGLDGENLVTFLDPGAMGGAPFLAVANATYLTTQITVSSSNRDLNLDGNVDLDPAIYPDGTVLPAGTIVDADISYNSDSYDWVTSPVSGGSIFDIQAVGTHEVGHFQGLSHSSITGPAPTMFPFVQSSVSGQLDQRELEHDDHASCSRLYPKPNFATSFASIAGRVLLDDPVGGEGVSVFAVDAVTMDPVVEVFSKSGINASGDPAGSFVIDGLPAGRYLVGVRYFDGADENTIFINRYNNTIGLSNVNNGNASAGDGTGLSFAPRPEFFSDADGDSDDLADATILDVSSPGDSIEGIEIHVNKADPVPPGGATALHLGDDAFKDVIFTSGFLFTFFDTVYESVNVGSNGYLTFGAGDTDFTESVNDFKGPEPRIACLFDDLNPGVDGTSDPVDVYVVQSSDLLEVYYLGVPEVGDAPSNTIVVRLHQSGEIEFDYKFVRSRDSIVGISPGGPSPNTHELDFTQEGFVTGFPEKALYEKFSFLDNPFDLWGGVLKFSPNENGGYDVQYCPPDNEITARITHISPDNGPEAGGTTVTVSGFGFTDVLDTVLLFGANHATNVNVLSSTSLTADTPPGTGSVNVSLTNSNGSDVLNSGFHYNPPPALTGVTPDAGPEEGGTEVTLVGQNFAPNSGLTGNSGVTVRFGENAATNVTVLSTTAIRATTPAGEGVVDVLVENENGSSLLNDGFSYTPPPTLTSLTPEIGPEFGGITITLFGNDFLPAEETDVYFGGTEALSVDVISATKIEAQLPPGEGVVDVKVHNENGFHILNDGFTYISPPDLQTLSPSSGPQAGGTRVTLTGQHFHDEGLVVFFGDLAGDDVEVISVNQVLATTPPGVGEVDVTVTNFYGSDTQNDGFQYLPPPRLDSVSPSFGVEGGGTVVTLHGLHFETEGVTTVLFGDQPLLSVDVLSNTQIVGVTPAGNGKVDIRVENPNGSDLLVQGFEYGVPPHIACRFGNVNENSGPITDVVFLNGSAGNAEREVHLDRTTPVACTVDSVPGQETSAYVMYIYFGAPGPGTEVNLPFNIGTMCFPTPLTGGFPQPVIIANNFGWPRILGRPNLSSSGAPEQLFLLKNGTRFPRTLYIQGMMQEDAKPSGVSVTNGMVLITE